MRARREAENSGCWPEGPQNPLFGHGEVHLWAAALDIPEPALARLAESLSSLETERAARFHFARHRDRFIAGRGFLRLVLARYLQVDPAALEFSYGAQGKPALAGIHSQNGLHFNLAHSDNLALLGVTRLGSVGVDVERLRALSDADELVARFFSPRESAAFGRLATEQKPVAFFNLWTRKEAWLKATGEGIGSLLSQVEVSFLPDDPARLLKLPESLPYQQSWLLEGLHPCPGFVGALALAAKAAKLKCWFWSGSRSSSLNE
jgi:4'-phosphopantetheinyl transferase